MSAREPDRALAALAEQTHGPAMVSRAAREGRRRYAAEQDARVVDAAVAEALDRIARPRAEQREAAR